MDEIHNERGNKRGILGSVIYLVITPHQNIFESLNFFILP